MTRSPVLPRLLPAAPGVALLVLATNASPAAAQWSRVHEQFYYPASHNWEFRDRYRIADRLFNAFDYGHAILYEVLYHEPNAPAFRLEVEQYDFITRKLLPKPPRVPLEEGAIEVAYAKLAPEAKAMFEWAHVLHRQLYDVLADERLSQEQKDREVATLLRYYRSRRDYAFSSVPKSMELMEGQYYSTAFRKGYPKFNGLIWAYHWLQVGLYEPLLVGRSFAERQTGVAATVARFFQMLENPPRNMPHVMPMTSAVAPTFAARYPEAAIIFDNLHSMHDVISDILASPEVPRSRKREEILRAAARYRDQTSYAMGVAEWQQMAAHMGIENMGGPAVGFLPEFPTPTVERGAVMAGMAGMQHGESMGVPAAAARRPASPGQHMPAPAGAQPGAHEHMRMPAQAQPDAHAGHAGAAPARAPADTTGRAALEFVTRLLADPSLESRIHSDPALHRLWSDPAVQYCLAELRKLKSAGRPLPRACPNKPR